MAFNRRREYSGATRLVLILMITCSLLSCSTEGKKWKAALKEDTLMAYSQFRDKYPEGRYAAACREKIDWLMTRGSQSLKHYENFLSKHPQSEYRQEAVEWENYIKAHEAHTLEAYEQFIAGHPDSRLSKSAENWIKYLTDFRLPAVRDAKTVKFSVSQSYGRAYSVHLPFEEITKGILRYTGLRFVGENADLTASIRVTGEARGKYYIFPERERFFKYSGASIKGTFSLKKRDGGQISQFSFSAGIWPPTMLKVLTYGRDEKPSDAPFDRVFKETNFIAKEFQSLYEIFGPYVFIGALGDGNRLIQENAASTLVKIGEPVVEPLISILNEKIYFVAKFNIYRILGDIKDPRSDKVLIGLLNKKTDPYLYEEAIRLLMKRETPGLVELLLLRIEEEASDRKRGVLVQGLGELKDPKAVEPLIAILKENNPALKDKVVDALGRIGDSRAIEPIIELFNSLNKTTTLIALYRITDTDAGTTQEQWQEWWEANKGKFQK